MTLSTWFASYIGSRPKIDYDHLERLGARIYHATLKQNVRPQQKTNWHSAYLYDILRRHPMSFEDFMIEYRQHLLHRV